MLLLLLVAGHLFGLPVLAWCLRDLGSFHRPLWPGYGNRQSWRKGAIVAYALGGWPIILFAFGWRTGRTRAGLVEERERLRELGSHSTRPATIDLTDLELDQEGAPSDADQQNSGRRSEPRF